MKKVMKTAALRNNKTTRLPDITVLYSSSSIILIFAQPMGRFLAIGTKNDKPSKQTRLISVANASPAVIFNKLLLVSKGG
ncbi:MAG TPA: hypothetical protein DDY13_09105 [Cytophagales bacterium]|nr:hypothetical protein [Cytophagales bacterium]